MSNKPKDKTIQCLIGMASRCWMLPCILCVIIATCAGITAAASTSWLRVTCDGDVTLRFGLHQVCFNNDTLAEGGDEVCQEINQPKGDLPVHVQALTATYSNCIINIAVVMSY